MHADFPAYQILHPLGQFTCQHISQRPRSSTHWNNQYVHRPSTVRKPPPTGGILLPTGLPASVFLHRMEEDTRAREQEKGFPERRARGSPGNRKTNKKKGFPERHARREPRR